MLSLESSPPAPLRLRERRWAVVSAWAIGLSLAGAGLAVHRLAQSGPAPAADAGPLPDPVRAQAQALLDRYLLGARLQDLRTGRLREFRIQGRARAPLAQEFYRDFRPAVADRLMPLLRPYGDIISFDIASLDLPPARLRPLPKD